MNARWASGGGGGEKSGGDKKFGGTMGGQSRGGGFCGRGGSGGGSNGAGDEGFLGGGGPGEPTARVSSVLHFGANKGAGTCDYVEWVDGEWDGRAKSVIKYLAMKNMKLETKIKDFEAEIKRDEKEKRAMVKMQKKILLYRDRILGFGALLYLGLFAIMIGVIVSK